MEFYRLFSDDQKFFMKKILIINTVYNGGGAAKVARQIFNYFSDSGEFDMYFAYGRGTTITNKKVFKFGIFTETLIHIFLVRFFGIEGFGTYFSTKRLINYIKKQKFDLVHIHNLHGYYLDFFTLVGYLHASEIKVVWTLHDEWSITWLPAHSMGCTHCKDLKGKCVCSYNYPRTYSTFFSQFMLNRKKSTFCGDWNPILICPSAWLKREIEKSYLGKCQARLIHNGVDTNLFQPVDRKYELRNKYQIPLDKKLILFSVSDINDSHKGYKYITDIINQLTNEEFFFIAVGNNNIIGTTNVRSFGYVNNENLLAEIYNLADIFLYTSLVETTPLTVLEAMACGLPVIAFNIPGVNELAADRGGLLSKVGDAKILIDSIEKIFNNNKMIKEVAVLAREKIVNDYSLDKMFTNYRKLYNDGDL